MYEVRAKKHLGQHFLTDKNTAQKIVESLNVEGIDKVLEIGAGTGVLTAFLLQNTKYETSVIEIDAESVDFLKNAYPQLSERIMKADFLKFDLRTFSEKPFAIIGNFPYNISSQILFKVLEHKNIVPSLTGMFQKEVAERICAKHGNKTYGILSVLIQAFYKVEYLFTVHEHVFQPSPKVKSAVIRLLRHTNEPFDCNETFFFRLVKQAFNQRRKQLRNSIKTLLTDKIIDPKTLTLRPEQLSVTDFIKLAKMLE